MFYIYCLFVMLLLYHISDLCNKILKYFLLLYVHTIKHRHTQYTYTSIAVYRRTYMCDKLIFMSFWLTFKIFKYSGRSVKQMLYFTCNHNIINKIIVKQYRYNINLNVYIHHQSQYRAVVIILLHHIKKVYNRTKIYYSTIQLI